MIDNGKPTTQPSGYSGIFHFPFRLHAEEELHGHEGQGRDLRYRVHAPFLVRRTGSPITDDVPQGLWPDFRWHEAVPEEARGEQASPPDYHYNTPSRALAIWYDGLRIDLWGPNAENRVFPLTVSAMRWLRHLSGQPWIGDVDRHYASIQKRSFPIDDSGAAVQQAGGLSSMTVAQFKFVTDAMWRSAFEHALWYRVPIHSNLFFDGVNAVVTHDHERAIMNLAMALESCRDISFSKIHPAEFVEGRGPKLKRPFHQTDLLKHLSVHSASIFGRDFSVEQPEHWPHLRNLYLARQHVAHGKGPVFPSDDGLRIVDDESLFAMQMAAGNALTWIEQLAVSIQGPVDPPLTGIPLDFREQRKPTT